MAAAPPRRSSWLLPKRDVSDTVDDVKTVTGSHLPELHSSSNSNRWSALPFLNKSASSLHTDTFMNALERTTSKNALERTTSKSTDKEKESRPSGSFGKMSFSSMMGGLSSLSLSRTPTNDKDEARGRSSSTIIRSRSSSSAPNSEPPSRSQSRARSQSPFSLRRFRTRETSPAPPQPLPLNQSDTELPTTAENSPHIRPRTAFLEDHGDDSGDETANEDHYSYNGETEDEEWSDDDLFDPVTERNTERNALTEPALPIGVADGEEVDPDPLGEGVNVVVPPEPYFPTTLNTYSSSASVGSSGSMRSRRNPRRRKSTKVVEPMPLTTSRPVFQRDRCTITLTQGNPPPHEDDRRRKRYVVASDLSDESRYALEWAIGTVLRDGDELLIVSVVENESKVDPANANAIDRATKLRSQQERQGMAYILARQATSLLQRTKLNVSVACQAWHSKNARHMLLDIVDYNEPIMLIVGSRGLSQLKGILLGSTSHYLIEKCSVPVMVARRRLKRPPRRSAHLAKHRQHVSLAEAGIDRVATKVDEDVRVMREQQEREEREDREEREEDRARGGPSSDPNALQEEESEEERENGEGVKVAG